MKKWYRGIVVKHKKIDNKMYHFFDDENFKILTEERNEQLKEIERLNNIINEEQDKISNAIDYIKSNKLVDIDIVLDKLYGGDKE